MFLNNVKMAGAAITLLLAASASAQPIRHFHRHTTVVEVVRVHHHAPVVVEVVRPVVPVVEAPVAVVHRRPRVIVERRVVERRIVDRRVVGRR